jgi:RNA recognition motif-containing protein
MNFVNTSLFIGDLPKFCNESDLEQLFAAYGPILDVKIKRNVNTGKTLSYGFVTLSTEALAADALRATDGAMFLGRKLRVRWAMYNARTQNPINQSIINSVYVRFVTSKV